MRTLRDRIIAKIHVPQDIHACWLWRGATSKKRYGQRRPSIWANGQARNAARIICAWANGDAPTPAHHAGHTCPHGENEMCVSPLHLTWQTPMENYLCRRSRKS